MEQELAREQELLRTIIDTIPAMITVYEPDERLLRLNPEFERVTGWSFREATGISLMEECYPDPEYREEVSRFMQSCREGWMDIRVRTRDGRDVETSWANIRLSDGTQVGIGIDITERKRAEEEARRLAAIIEATPDFVAVADLDGRLGYLNAAGYEMLGLGPEADLQNLRSADLCPSWVYEQTQQEWMPLALREGAASG